MRIHTSYASSILTICNETIKGFGRKFKEIRSISPGKILYFIRKSGLIMVPYAQQVCNRSHMYIGCDVHSLINQ